MPWIQTSPMQSRSRFAADDRLGLHGHTELRARYSISRRTGCNWLVHYHQPAVNPRWYCRCAWKAGIPASPRPCIPNKVYHTEKLPKSQDLRYGSELGGQPTPSSRDPARRATLHVGAAKQAGFAHGSYPRTPLPARAVARCMLRPGQQE